MLYDDLEEWEQGWVGREAQEGEAICIPMADSHCCKQKSTHCKAIILQFKKMSVVAS